MKRKRQRPLALEADAPQRMGAARAYLLKIQLEALCARPSAEHAIVEISDSQLKAPFSCAHDNFCHINIASRAHLPRGEYMRHHWLLRQMPCNRQVLLEDVSSVGSSVHKDNCIAHGGLRFQVHGHGPQMLCRGPIQAIRSRSTWRRLK